METKEKLEKLKEYGIEGASERLVGFCEVDNLRMYNLADKTIMESPGVKMLEKCLDEWFGSGNSGIGYGVTSIFNIYNRMPTYMSEAYPNNSDFYEARLAAKNINVNDLSPENVEKVIKAIMEDTYFDVIIHIRYNSKVITDDRGRTHEMRGLYANIHFNSITVSFKNIYCNRSTYAMKEIVNGYMYSHAPHKDDTAFVFEQCCLGTDAMGKLRVEMSKFTDKDDNMKRLQIKRMLKYIDLYFSQESSKGKPYIPIKSLSFRSSDNNIPYYATSSTSTPYHFYEALRPVFEEAMMRAYINGYMQFAHVSGHGGKPFFDEKKNVLYVPCIMTPYDYMRSKPQYNITVKSANIWEERFAEKFSSLFFDSYARMLLHDIYLPSLEKLQSKDVINVFTKVNGRIVKRNKNRQNNFLSNHSVRSVLNRKAPIFYFNGEPVCVSIYDIDEYTNKGEDKNEGFILLTVNVIRFVMRVMCACATKNRESYPILMQ